MQAESHSKFVSSLRLSERWSRRRRRANARVAPSLPSRTTLQHFPTSSRPSRSRTQLLHTPSNFATATDHCLASSLLPRRQRLTIDRLTANRLVRLPSSTSRSEALRVPPIGSTISISTSSTPACTLVHIQFRALHKHLLHQATSEGQCPVPPWHRRRSETA